MELAEVLVKEIENLASKDSNSTLCNTEDAVHTFEWDLVWDELKSPVMLYQKH